MHASASRLALQRLLPGWNPSRAPRTARPYSQAAPRVRRSSVRRVGLGVVLNECKWEDRRFRELIGACLMSALVIRLLPLSCRRRARAGRDAIHSHHRGSAPGIVFRKSLIEFECGSLNSFCEGVALCGIAPHGRAGPCTCACRGAQRWNSARTPL